ncbi:MBL fold metallo-hydrolase [Proteus vulgaris]|uniref:MBL fold metallo-hydrolase n=1 Tax=Proteus vulgaris TaxID=585 RepID=UPI0021B0F3E3|nr:MBL fold metallo-hydrolase [Proteus vulgaris]MCT6518272.1 MBL fold metallo-hydrolase [Proteus vulgaris]
MNTAINIQAFFDEESHTVTYLVSDPKTKQAAVIDPVLDYNHASGTVSTTSADTVLKSALEQKLTIIWILETHAHADHLSAAVHIQKLTGAQIAIGEHIKDVQKIFAKKFNQPHISTQGIEFDKLLADGEEIMLGQIPIKVIHTPGHTPACVSYHIENAVFVGDTLFMPDYGTARADFPGGDAKKLYRSIQKLFALPEETILYMCHDYKAPGRDHYAWETTVAEARSSNIHVHEGVTEEQFVTMRKQRDAGLAAPKLLLPSIQVNIQAGEFPEPESNGTQYLKIPLSFKTK